MPADELIRRVSEELRNAGIIVTTGIRERMEAQVWLRGQHEFQRLRREMANDIRPFFQPIMRSLGTGASITAFAISPVPVPREFHRPITALGGLASLIVSAFDVLLDRGDFVPDIFAPAASPEALHSKAAVIRELVAIYYRRLEELPQRRAGVRPLIENAIRRMYHAELRSAHRIEAGRSVWWRKNVLPFVVMGLPAWLVCSDDGPVRLRNHLVWLCRLGEFFGWLDDCVDWAEDLKWGRTNRVDGRLRSVSAAVMARRIAAQGRRVLDEWDRWSEPSELRDFFAVLVWSWIENSPRAATS